MAASDNAVLGVDEPLIGLRSQQVDLGLLGARTAAVLRRIAAGNPLDEYDHQILGHAEAMLRDTADAIEFVSSSGLHGSHPKTYSFGAVAITLEAAARDEPDESVVHILRSLADTIRASVDSSDVTKAESIIPVFSSLTSIAISSAGSPGDSVQSH